MTDGRERPFRVLGIQQVAIGGLDKERLRALWVGLFGLEVTGNFRSERENVDEDICSLGSGPLKVEVDLMQPIDPEGRPAVQATPLNHIGLWVDDLPRAVEWLAALVSFDNDRQSLFDPLVGRKAPRALGALTPPAYLRTILRGP